MVVMNQRQTLLRGHRPLNATARVRWMRYGVTIFATDRTPPITDVARWTEALGFDSLWVPEHTHVPTSRRTPAPLGGGDLPEEYRRTLDPFVALSAVAAVTERIRLGTGIALIAQRDPIVTAKEAATLSLMSGGRFSLGIGFGWNEDELNDHGVQMSERRAVVRDRVLGMRELWTAEKAAYSSEHFELSESWAWPKPTDMPVLLGGMYGPKLESALVEYCDGWIPMGGSGVRDAMPKLRMALERAGRDPSDFSVIPFGSSPSADKLDYFESIGVNETVFSLPSGSPDEVHSALEAHAEVIGPRRSGNP